MNSNCKTTLKGKTILIARAPDQLVEIKKMLEQREAKIFCLPSIEIKDPVSWEKCDKVIWKLAEYQAVCFASKNSVVKFIERIRAIRPQALDTLSTRNIYAIGDLTRRTIESSGFSVLTSTKHPSTQELAASLQSHQLKGSKILFPISQIACNTFSKQLCEMGANIEEVIVFNAEISGSVDLKPITDLITKNQINVIVFFSSSSAVNFAEYFGNIDTNALTAFAINNTTAETLYLLGYKNICIAKQAKAEDLVDIIEKSQ